MSEKEPSYLEDLPEHRLAYFKTEGGPPTVVFMGGLMSDMTGTKALFLENLCRDKGWGYVRFDYSGHGQSSGVFRKETIGAWRRDTLSIIDGLTKGPLVVVGSSMGGWLALLAALARPDRVKGLIGLAPAPDFTERLLWPGMTSAQKQEFEQTGEVRIPSEYGDDPYIFTRVLFEEARTHFLLDGAIPLRIPVRLIHGLKDNDVPAWVSEEIMARLEGDDAELTLLEEGDHRLSSPEQLECLTKLLEDVVAKITSQGLSSADQRNA